MRHSGGRLGNPDSQTSFKPSQTLAGGAIRALPDDVASQVKSAAIITSLEDVVLELLKNALDAESTNVEISIDARKGACVVEDNGIGIEPKDFLESGGLLKTYCESSMNLSMDRPLTWIDTSKHEAGKETHGRHGTFLASLSALCLLSITSHHHLYRSHNVLTVYRSKPLARLVPALSQHELCFRDHGTKVAVSDLFGNLPVRVKQRAVRFEEKTIRDKNWDGLKQDVLRLLIAWNQPVVVRIQDAAHGKLVLNTLQCSGINGHLRGNLDPALATTLLAQSASYVQPSDFSDWISISASTSFIEVQGIISLSPAPNKHNQFISFGIHPMSSRSGHNELYTEINRQFYLSSFGVEDSASDVDDLEKERRRKDGRYKTDGVTNIQTKLPRKGVDRHPMFCLSIIQKKTGQNAEAGELFQNEAKMHRVVEVLGAVVKEWLVAHQFRPRQHQRQSPRKAAGNATAELNSKHIRMDGAKPATGSLSKEQLESSKRFHNFSSWSRIKSGKPQFLEELWLSSKVSTPSKGLAARGENISPASNRPTTTSTDFGARTPQIQIPTSTSTSDFMSSNTNSSNAVRIGGFRSPSTTPALTVEDDPVSEWIDPKTKEHFVFNARTGCCVPERNEPFELPPASSLASLPLRHRISSRSNIARRLRKQSTRNSGGRPDFLSDWSNPVFERAEQQIPRVSCNMVTGGPSSWSNNNTRQTMCGEAFNPFKDASIESTSTVSRDDLNTAEVVAQVDKKFVLVRTGSKLNNAANVHSLTNNRDVLVLIDQHAADERCRVEEYMDELCRPASEEGVLIRSQLGHRSRVATTVLDKPVTFQLSSQEYELAERHASHFAEWGILYDLSAVRDDEAASSRKGPSSGSARSLSVKCLPLLIADRCKADPKILVSLIRSELWKVYERSNQTRGETSHDEFAEKPWLSRLSDCPQGLLDMINSRACRSAIMFHDPLDKTQCEDLVRRLTSCSFPFQCAHGRPSMVPLVDLALVRSEIGTKAHSASSRESHNQGSYKAAYKAWRNSK